MKILVAYYIVYLILAVLHKSRADFSVDEQQEIIEELQELTEIVHPVKCTNESTTTFQCCISPKLGGINRLICHIFEINIEQKSIDHYLTFNKQKLYKRKLMDGEYCRLFPLWPRTKICKNTINAVIDLNSEVPSFDACFEIKILFNQLDYLINQQYKCFGVDKEAHFFAHDIGDTNQQQFGFLIPNKLPLPNTAKSEEVGFPTSEELHCPSHCLSIKGNTVLKYEQEVTVYKDGKEQKAILTIIHKLDLINDSAKNSVSTDSNVTADTTSSTVPTTIASITDTTVSSAIEVTSSNDDEHDYFYFPTLPEDESYFDKTVEPHYHNSSVTATTAKTTKRTVPSSTRKMIPRITTYKPRITINTQKNEYDYDYYDYYYYCNIFHWTLLCRK